MTTSRRTLLSAAALAIAAGPRIALAAGGVEGSGTALVQRRDGGAFSAVAVGGPFAVVLRPAAKEAIEVRADDNLLALIETTVEEHRGRRSLRIELARGARIRPRTPIVVTVDVVRLDAIAVGGDGTVRGAGLRGDRLKTLIGGSGTIALSGVDGKEIDVSIGGSGAVELDGRTAKLDVSIAGSGRLDAARLVATDVSVSVAGSGDTRVHAEGSLSVSIVGSGDVVYSGPAMPTSSIVGSGRLRKAA